MRICETCGAENPEHASFCLACGGALQRTHPSNESRKVVTVLFCDVVGSTSLGEREDPEVVRLLMQRYFADAKDAIERHGGAVEKFIGDAVVAVFGIPNIHEDDAARALRAAIDIQSAVAKINAEIGDGALAVRIGVNTGEVLASGSDSGEAMVVGDTVNTAARLQQSAEPGDVLIGPTTSRMVQDAATLEGPIDLDLKGKAEPLSAFRIKAVSATSTRPLSKRSKLIGRQKELDLLKKAIANLKASSTPDLMTILGVAGVGKSRLVSEAIRDTNDVVIVSGRCLPYGEGITFWPIREIIFALSGITEEDPQEVVRTKIEGLVAGIPEAEIVGPRIAALAGVGSPTTTTEEMFWALRRLIEEMTRPTPMVIIFDDIHWAEPKFLELIEYLLTWSAGARFLVIAMARPDLLDDHPGWGAGHRSSRTIPLEPLPPEETARLAIDVLDGLDLPDQVLERIAEAAAGNPLFVQELAVMLVDERVIDRDGDRWLITGDISRIPIPPTITALLGARLDKLEPRSRRLLERAAIVGGHFSASALRALYGVEHGDAILSGLMDLVRRDLVIPQPSGRSEDDGFRFRHLLIRDAAYGSIPKQVRSELHERFAHWVESTAGERADEYLEIIGHHLEQAAKHALTNDDRTRRLRAEAYDRLQAAGRRATVRSDAHAAITLWRRAIDLSYEEASVQLIAELIRLLVQKGDFDQAEELIDLARRRAERSDHELDLAQARLAESTLHFYRGDHDVSMVSAQIQELLAIFDRNEDERSLAAAWYLLAECDNALCIAEKLAETSLKAMEHARRCGDAHTEQQARFWYGAALGLGPAPVDQIAAEGARALEEAEPRSLARALLVTRSAVAPSISGDLDTARKLCAEGRALLLELGYRIYWAATADLAGMIELFADDAEAAESIVRPAVESLQEIGEKGYLSTVVLHLGEALYRQGRLHEALEAVDISVNASDPDDLASQSGWRSLKAKIDAQKGDFEGALRLSKEAVDLWGVEADYWLKAMTLLDRAEVLRAAGLLPKMRSTAQEALVIFERKQHIPGIRMVQRFLHASTS